MTQRPKQPFTISITLRIVAGLILLVAIGTLLLLLPIATTKPIRPIDAFFTAVSALSVTGLTTIAPGSDLTTFGQVVLLLLIQVGGVGFMATAALLLSLFGRKLSLSNRLALTDSLGLATPQMITQLTLRVMAVVVALESLGAIGLYLNWRDQLGERAAFYAIFHAVSSFCNAGFDLFGGLAEYPNGLPTDGFTLAILGSMIFLGGLGIPIFSDLLSWRSGRMVTLHTRLTTIVVIALVLVGWFGIWLAETRPGSLLADKPLAEQLGRSLFQSISLRTAGFAGIQPFDQLSPATQILMVVLMFIGCAPASMGGGITTGTFAVLVLAVGAYARRESSVQIAQRSIPAELVRKAAMILTISLLLTLLSTWMLLLTHPFSVSEALFEVVSAFATCGLTLAVTGRLEPFGMILIAVVMFWGRLGALTLVLALAQPQQARISYPEEQVLIG
jgi:trk system potassium uptake protein TrkH